MFLYVYLSIHVSLSLSLSMFLYDVSIHTGGADVTGRVGSPCDTIHTGCVVFQGSNRGAGNTDIKYYHLVRERGLL